MFKVTNSTDHQHIGQIVNQASVAVGDNILFGDYKMFVSSVLLIEDGSIIISSPNYIVWLTPHN